MFSIRIYICIQQTLEWPYCLTTKSTDICWIRTHGTFQRTQCVVHLLVRFIGITQNNCLDRKPMDVFQVTLVLHPRTAGMAVTFTSCKRSTSGVWPLAVQVHKKVRLHPVWCHILNFITQWPCNVNGTKTVYELIIQLVKNLRLVCRDK